MITVDARLNASDAAAQCDACDATSVRVMVAIENPDKRRRDIKEAFANNIDADEVARIAMGGSQHWMLCDDCRGKLTHALILFDPEAMRLLAKRDDEEEEAADD